MTELQSWNRPHCYNRSRLGGWSLSCRGGCHGSATRAIHLEKKLLILQWCDGQSGNLGCSQQDRGLGQPCDNLHYQLLVYLTPKIISASENINLAVSNWWYLNPLNHHFHGSQTGHCKCIHNFFLNLAEIGLKSQWCRGQSGKPAEGITDNQTIRATLMIRIIHICRHSNLTERQNGKLKTEELLGMVTNKRFKGLIECYSINTFAFLLNFQYLISVIVFKNISFYMIYALFFFKNCVNLSTKCTIFSHESNCSQILCTTC